MSRKTIKTHRVKREQQQPNVDEEMEEDGQEEKAVVKKV